MARWSLKNARAPRELRAALTGYFKGDLDRLAAIEWRVAGTPFQQKVWNALPEIPAGTTLSYGALAAKLRMPRAVRAVGHANGSNPISVVLPCHRLIGANGSLVKYGGGLERKRWLLRHEGVEVARCINDSLVGVTPPAARRCPRSTSRWISALLIAACRVGAVIWAPSRSVT